MKLAKDWVAHVVDGGYHGPQWYREIEAELVAVQVDALESAANICGELIGDASRPKLAAGAAECMIAIRRRSDELTLKAPIQSTTLAEAVEPPTPPPADFDPFTCEPIEGDFNGPHGPPPGAKGA